MLTNPIMLKISAAHDPVALLCGTLHLLVFLLMHQLSSLFSSLGLPHVGHTDIGKQLWFHYLLFPTDALHPRWAHLASWLELLPNVDSQTRFLTLSSPQCSRFAHSTTCCLANCLTSLRCAHSRAPHPLSVPCPAFLLSTPHHHCLSSLNQNIMCHPSVLPFPLLPKKIPEQRLCSINPGPMSSYWTRFSPMWTVGAAYGVAQLGFLLISNPTGQSRQG